MELCLYDRDAHHEELKLDTLILHLCSINAEAVVQRWSVKIMVSQN